MSSNVFERTRWVGGTGLISRTLAGWFDTGKEKLADDLDPRTEREDKRLGSHFDTEVRTRQEQVRLVQRVFLARASEARRAVLFAGVEADNGCAEICVRAGQTLARLTGQSVCVVDANLRSPLLHRLAGLDNREGFVDVVAQPGSASTLARRLDPTNFWLLPAGSSASDPDLLLTADRMRPSVHELVALFDRTLISAPPINLYAESLALSQFVHGVVLVLSAHVTRREIVRKMKDHLEDLNVPLLGIVLNDRTFPIPKVVYRFL